MKFSVITCTYNSKRFIARNIESVSSQSYKGYEHLFVDAYSTDGTVEIIKGYEKKNPGHVKLYQSPPKGIAHAMNEGIKQAKGDFLIHLHSDDSFYDGKVLQDVSDLFAINNGYDWIYGKANVIEEDGRSIGIFPDRKMLQYDNGNSMGRYFLKYFNYIPHQAVFIKRAVFERLGYFDEAIKIEMDYDMWLRIKDKTRWSFFNRVVCNYMIRAGAQSSSLAHRKEVLKDHESIQKRHMNLFEYSIVKQLNILIRFYNKSYR